MSTETKREAIILDGAVDQADVLMKGLSESVRSPVVVSPDEDPSTALQQLLNDPSVTGLHVLGHGKPGGVRVGSRWLTPEDFRMDASVGAQRPETLEIYFWSCRTGAEARGEDFMQRISEQSMSHVFASTGLIGDKDQGGSWQLDTVTKPRAAVPFSQEARDAFGVVLVVPSIEYARVDDATNTITFVFNTDVAVSGEIERAISIAEGGTGASQIKNDFPDASGSVSGNTITINFGAALPSDSSVEFTFSTAISDASNDVDTYPSDGASLTFNFSSSTAPTVNGSPSLDLQASDDTGDLDDDNVTNETAPTVLVSVDSGDLNHGDVVEIIDRSDSDKVVGFIVSDGTALNNQAIQLDTLADGNHDLDIRIVSGTNGEASSIQEANLDITVDTIAPDLTGSGDIGFDEGANGINANEASNGTAVTIDLPDSGAASGDTLTVEWGSSGATTNYTLTAADVSGDSATITIASGDIASAGDGEIAVTASIADQAGNVGAAVTNTVTVDTTAPDITTNSFSVWSGSTSATFTILATDAIDIDNTSFSGSGLGTGLSVSGDGTLTVSSIPTLGSSVSGDITVSDVAGNTTTETVVVSSELFAVFDSGDSFSAAYDTFAAANTAASGGETIKIADDGNADVDSYALSGDLAISIDASLDVNGVELIGNSAANTLTGGASGDTINGGAGADIIIAGSGDDTITGGGGADTLTGGAGADTFVFASGDVASGEVVNSDSSDTIEVSDGANISGVDAEGSGAGSAFNADSLTLSGDASVTMTVAQHEGFTTITAAGTEQITLSDAGTASGDSNVETYVLADGTNTFTAADGGQTVVGGTGADTITGGTGADDLSGGGGSDTITGGGGSDTIDGGTGDDTLIYADGSNLSGDTSVDGGAGDDTIRFTSASASVDDADFANVAADSIETVELTGDGNTSITLGSSGDAATSGLTITGADQTAAGSGDTIDVSSMTEAVTINAGSGDDTITGGAGADTINAGSGDDTLIYADGSDLSGDTSVDGGAGDDTIRFTSASASVDDADFANVAADSIETVELTGDGNTSITLGSSGDAATSGLTITGADQTAAGSGDTIDVSSMTEAVTINAGSGDDTITGGSSGDTIDAGSGDDTITGGAGADDLTGGAGADTFVFASGDVASGEVVNSDSSDTIELSTGADISAINAENNGAGSAFNADNLTLSGDASVTMTVAQHESFTTFTAADNETVTLTDSGDFTGDSAVENYVLAAGTNTFTLGSGSQSVDATASSGDTIDVQGLTATGTIETVTGDTIELSTGANISGVDAEGSGAGSAFNADTLTLSGDASVTMTVAQHEGFTTITAAGTEQITLSDAGTASGDSNVETYVLADGTNTFTAADGGQTVVGGTGADTITGGTGADDLSGGGGSDTITGGGGSDTIDGGTGDDTLIYADGSNLSGDTSVDGGAGDDTIRFTSASASVDDADFANVAADSIETVELTGDGNTSITLGSSGDAATSGLTITGADQTAAGSGDTIDVSSMTEAVTINAGSGDDTITGGAGADTINAGSGDDTLIYADGSDLSGDTSVDGGAGDDTIRFTSASASVDDADFANVAADSIETVELTGDGNTSITLGSSGDAATSGLTITGADQTAAGSGDTIDVSSMTEAVTINAGSGDDTITGGAGADTINAGSGDDTITGGAGADDLTGGAGDDTFKFATGDVATGETLADGSGTTTISTAGGGSVDFSALNSGDQALTDVDDVLLQAGSTATFTGAQLNGQAINVNATGTTATTLDIDVADGTTADLSNLTFTASTGDDFTSGTDVVDIDAGAGSAGVDITGTSLADSIAGGDGADTLRGGDGDDDVIGGAGGDTLEGGAGADTLTGGLGSDTINGDAGNDVIVYTTPGEINGDSLNAGAGSDTVRIDNAGTYDFGELNSASGIETLLIADDSANSTVTLTKLVPTSTTFAITGDDGGALNSNITLDGSALGSTQSITIDGDDFAGTDSFTAGSGDDEITYASAGTDYTLSISGTGGSQVVTVSQSGGDTDTLRNIETIDFTDADVLIVGAGGYADIAAAATAAASGDSILIDSAEAVSVATAQAIDSKNLTFENGITLTDITDTAANISAADFSSSALNSFTTITNETSGGTASLDAAELGSNAITLSGSGDFTVTGSETELSALSATTYGSLDASGDSLILEDTAANITGLTLDEINDLVNTRGLDEVQVSGSGTVELTIAQTDGFGASGAISDTSTSNTLASGVTLPAFEYIASSGDDLLVETASGDTINAGAGNDIVRGLGGNDDLKGEAGDDELDGGSGDDTLTGGAGNDTLSGGAGEDTAVFGGDYNDYTITRAGDDSTLTVTDDRAGSPDGTDTLDGVEVLQFADQDVRIVGVGGYADVSAAVAAAGSGDEILLSATTTVTVADAKLISDNSLTFNVTIDTIKDTVSNISGAAENELALENAGYTRYDTIEVSGSGTVTLDASQLGGRSLTLSGDFSVSGDLTEVKNLDRGTALNQIDNLTVVDTAANLAAETVAEINDLKATTNSLNHRGVNAFVQSDSGDIELSKAQIEAYSTDANNSLLTPAANVVQIGTSSGETLTAFGSSQTGYSLAENNTTIGGETIDGQIIDGKGGNDRISGGSDNDLLIGGSGNDILTGGNADDLLRGGTGNDIYIVTTGDIVDEVTNGDGSADEARTDQSSYTLTADVEILRYTGGGTFSGTGNSGNNTIFGGSGDDTLSGGSGDDVLFGGAGADTLRGQAGDDIFIVGTDSRTDARSATQTVTSSTTDYANDAEVSGGSGTDTIRFQGTQDNQELFLDTNTSGVERIEITSSIRGSTSLALDVDASALADDSEAHSVDFTALSLAESSGSASIDGVEIIGSDGANTLRGTDFQDVIQGGSGADALYGGSGDDFLYAGTGDDQLAGGAGNDILVGEAGDDQATGGAGDDVFFGGAGNDTFIGGAGNDTAVIDSGDTIVITGDDRFASVATVTVDDGAGEIDRYEEVETLDIGGSIVNGAFVSGGSSFDLTNDFRVLNSAGELQGAYATIDDALSNVTVSGGSTTDTIAIADGATVASGTLTGSLTAGLTIIGSGTTNAATFEDALTIDVANVTVDGLRFSVGSGDTAITVGASGDGASILDTAIAESGGNASATGIEVTDTSVDVTIDNSDFNNLGTGINLVSGYDATASISGSTLVANAVGVLLDGVGASGDIDIENNIFVDNTTAGVDFEGASGDYTDGGDVRIYLNRFEVPTSGDGVDANGLTFSGSVDTSLTATLGFNTYNTFVNDAGVADTSSIAIDNTGYQTLTGYVIEGTSSGGETASFNEPDSELVLDLTNTGSVDLDADGTDDGTYVTGTLGSNTIYISTSGDVSTIENITGTDVADTITGDDNANVLSGVGGDDIINGGGGNDRLDGGDGDDRIDGGSGDDTLIGAAGDDYLEGGAGNDTYDVDETLGSTNYFAGGSGDDTAAFERDIDQYQINRADELGSDYSGSGDFFDEFYDLPAGMPADVSLLPNFDPSQPIFRIDYIDGGQRQTDYVQAESIQFNDVTLIWGTLGDLGQSGLEATYGSGDIFVTSSGDAAFTYNGGGQEDRDTQPNFVLGSSGNDTITGSDGQDVIIGLAGDDVIRGGVGADTLDGGEGEDDYLITPQVYNDDNDNFVGNEFTTNDSIADTGSGDATEVDQAIIDDGGNVNFTLGTLTGVEEVQYFATENNFVTVTSDQFDGVDKFYNGTSSNDQLEIDFSENGESTSQTIVDDVESLILDTNTDESGGENLLDAENVAADTNVYVRGGSATNNDRLEVENLSADLFADIQSYASDYEGVLEVDLADNAGEVRIFTGSDDTSVTTRAGSSALIDASYLNTGDLFLDGVGNVTAVDVGSITIDASQDLLGDAETASPLTGLLDITTINNANYTLNTGTNNTTVTSNSGTGTIDATQLRNDFTLTLDGSSDTTVTELQGDVVATNSSGTLDVTTATVVDDDDVSITTGSNNTKVTGTDSGDTVTVNADRLSTSDTLTVDGDANFVVNNVASDVNVDADGDGAGSALQGTLTVNVDVGATNVDVFTGVDTTTVNAGSGGSTGSIRVEADELANNTDLVLTGDSIFDVNDLTGDVDASGQIAGELLVSTVDNTDDNGLTVTTGNTDVTVDTAEAGDTITVQAAGMDAAGSETLTLAGSSAVVVQDLVQDLDADGTNTLSALSGTLDVTTGTLADSSGTEFILGTGVSTITTDVGSGDSGQNIDLTIDATALGVSASGGTDLTVDGDADVAIDGLGADTDASNLTGLLDIDARAGANSFDVATGSAAATITGATGNTITIDATALSGDGTVNGDAANAELTLDGTGTVTVNNLDADVFAGNYAGASGDTMTLNTDAVTGDENGAALEFVTGSTDTVINGTDSVSGDTDTIDIRVDGSNLAGQTGESLALQGDAEYVIENNDDNESLLLNISGIADNNTVKLDGIGDFELTGTSADVDAEDVSGDIAVRTKDDGNADDIEVTAGTGVTTVDAVDSIDSITLLAGNLTDDINDTRNENSGDRTEVIVEGSGDVDVQELKADLDASSFEGTLTIDRGQITGSDINDVDIQVGTNGARIDAGSTGQASYVDTAAMGSGQTLTLQGDSTAFTVDNLGSGGIVDAAGTASGDTALTGALTVDAADGAQNAIVRTGSVDTTVNANNGSITVDADQLDDAATQDLTLTGSSTFTVNNLETNLLAGSTSGIVDVSTDAISGDGTNPALVITAGTGTLSVSGDDANDTDTSIVDIQIDADNLSDSNTATDLTLTGDAEYVVTSDAGSGEVTIDASGLDASGGLSLEGSGDFRLVNATSDVQAPDLTGRLTVETDSGTENDITVTAGSGPLGVDATDSNDDITVNANKIVDDEIDNEVSLGGNSGTDAYEIEAEGAGTVTLNNLAADVDARNLTNTLTANVTGGSDVDIVLNQADSTINTNSTNVTLDADFVGSGDTVTLNQGGTVTVLNADNGVTVDGGSSYSGDLTVRTDSLSAGDTVTVKTSSAETTVVGSGGSVDVDASALADNIDLIVEGDSSVDVTNLQGDVEASGSSGPLDVTTISGASVAITTGTGNATVSSDSGDVTVNADQLTNGSTLTVDGDSTYTVNNVAGGVLVDGVSGDAVLEGTLTVNMDAGANNVDVNTGTAATTVNSDTSNGGSVTVEADQLADDVILTLTGAATATVNDIIGDLDASGSTGTLGVTTGDNTGASGDGDIDITLGNASAGVTTTGASDQVNIAADNMTGDSFELAVGGSSDVVVTGLVEDLDADGNPTLGTNLLSGVLTATTGALANNAQLNITLGGNSSTINVDEVDTGSGSETEVIIDARDMVGGSAELTLTGDGEVEVDNLSRDLKAGSLSGDLDVDTVDDSTLTITAGSGDTTVTTATGADITVDATGLSVDGDAATFELTIDGEGSATVNSLAADLDASGQTQADNGVLTVTTQTNAAVNIKTNEFNNFLDASGASSSITADAGAMVSGTRLSAYGDGSFDISNVGTGVTVDADGTTGEAALQGSLAVETTSGASGVLVETGVANTSVTGDSGDYDVDATLLANDKTLTLSGTSAAEITDLIADVNASSGSGTLDITTRNNTVDNDMTVTTSAGATTINADHAGDTITVDATPLADDTALNLSGDSNFVVTDFKGDLDADNGAGSLTVTLADASDISLDVDRATTVSGDAFGDGNTLELKGTGDVTITGMSGDIDASVSGDAALTGDLTVTTSAIEGATGAPAMFIDTGEGSTTVNGDDADDADTETVDIVVDATAMADNSDATVLNLGGDAEYRLVNNASLATGKVQVDLTNSTNVGLVDLTGSGEYDLVETSADITAGNTTGPLTITTEVATGNTIEVTAGTGDLTVDAANAADAVTVDAAQLGDDAADNEVSGSSVVGNDSGDSYELTVEGPGGITVTALGADLDAASHSGDLDVTLQSSISGIDDVDIKLNSANATIDTNGTDVTLDATQMGSGDTATLEGAGNAEVTNLQADATIDGQSSFTGTLDVYSGTLSSGDSATVKTGTGQTMVDGDGNGAMLLVEADKLTNGGGADDLTLRGNTQFTVTALGADLLASGTTGFIDVTTEAADSSNDTFTVTTGSGDITITGSDSGDSLTIDADELASGDTLTIDGVADATVNNVATGVIVDADGDGVGSALADTLTVNLDSGATNVTVKTGTENTTVSGGSSVTVEAAELTDNNTLTLTGAAAATVTGLIGDVDASGSSGTLDITTSATTANAVTVTTGTGDTTIDAAASGDTVTVAAGNLADDTGDTASLSLSGDGSFIVNALEGNVTATAGSGDLTVQLETAADNNSRVDSDRTTTVQAGKLEANDTLEIAGSGDITVAKTTDGSGDATDGIRVQTVDAAQSSGHVTIETAPLAGTNASGDVDPTTFAAASSEAYLTVTAGTGDLTVDADDSVSGDDVGFVSRASGDRANGQEYIVDVAIDHGNMGSGDTITLKGDAEYFLDNVDAIVRASEIGTSEGFSGDRGDGAQFPTNPNDGSTYPPVTGGIDSNLVSTATGGIYLTGGTGNNDFLGGGGDDYISGGEGDDVLRGGAGEDLIIGGDGADSLYGGDADDLLFGGSGKDGEDFISGGDGIDTAVFVFTKLGDGGAYQLLIDENGNNLTETAYNNLSSGDQASVETYTYEFIRTTGDSGTEVQVQVELTDASGDAVFTDRVLTDVERFLFINPGDDPEDAGDGETLEELVGSVINVFTGEKFSTIQDAVDDSDTLDGHEILVTPDSFDEAFVTKDLTFFIQAGATGVELTLANQDGGTDPEPDITVFSEANITINGNGGDNNITILTQDDLKTYTSTANSDYDDQDASGSGFGSDDDELDVFELIGGEGGSGDTLFGKVGVTEDGFDAASYTIYGRGGDDTIAVDPNSTKSHFLFGGSGNDFIAGGQALDWLDGGSGNDVLIASGGNDRMLGGSGNDEFILATRDDTDGGDGRVLMLLGGGDDQIIVSPVDNSQGIDIEAIIGDFARGDDQLNFEGLSDASGGTVDANDLFESGVLSGDEIDLDGFGALYEDGNGGTETLTAEGSIRLLGTNLDRLSSSDFVYDGTGDWRDEFDQAVGLANIT